MSDLISRQAVLDGIDVKAWEFCDYLISKGRNDEQKPVSHFADNLREYIREELPSVTPVPKTGHWIVREDNTSFVRQFPRGWVECSHCGWSFSYDRIKDDYCSKCGAKMESEE